MTVQAARTELRELRAASRNRLAQATATLNGKHCEFRAGTFYIGLTSTRGMTRAAVLLSR